MQERKKRGTEYREDLYIRKLIILTFLTLLFVLSVFISALGRQHDPSTGDYTGTSDNGSPETTAVWVTTAGEGAEDLPGTTGVLETTEPPGPGGSPETTDTPGTTHNRPRHVTSRTHPDHNPDVVPTRTTYRKQPKKQSSSTNPD